MNLRQVNSAPAATEDLPVGYRGSPNVQGIEEGRAERRILEHERPKKFMKAQLVDRYLLSSLKRNQEANEKVRELHAQWIVADFLCS